MYILSLINYVSVSKACDLCQCALFLYYTTPSCYYWKMSCYEVIECGVCLVHVTPAGPVSESRERESGGGSAWGGWG